MAKKTHRTPHFTRQESWRHLRVKESWRRPRGKTSKMRLGMRGWPKTVKLGYKRKLQERGLHPSGLRETLVRRPEDLDNVDSKTQIVKISHSVGERKRIAITERAQALELTMANPIAKKKAEATPTEELVVKEEPEETEPKGEEMKEEPRAEGNTE